MIRVIGAAFVLLAVVTSLEPKRSVVLCRPKAEPPVEDKRREVLLEDAARPAPRATAKERSRYERPPEWGPEDGVVCYSREAVPEVPLDPTPQRVTLDVLLLDWRGHPIPDQPITLTYGRVSSRDGIQRTTDLGGRVSFEQTALGWVVLRTTGSHGLQLARFVNLKRPHLERWTLTIGVGATGWVTQGGRSVAGATVALVHCKPSSRESLERNGLSSKMGRAPACLGRTETRPDGSFSLSVDARRTDWRPLFLVAQRGDGIPLIRNWDQRESHHPIELQLPSTRRIAGTVTYANGEPAAGCALQTYIAGRSSGKVGCTYASSTGHFELDADPQATSLRAIGAHGEVEALLPFGEGDAWLDLTLPTPRHCATIRLADRAGYAFSDHDPTLRGLSIEVLRSGSTPIRLALDGRAQLSVYLGRLANVGDPYMARVRGPSGYHSKGVAIREDSVVTLRVHSKPREWR